MGIATALLSLAAFAAMVSAAGAAETNATPAGLDPRTGFVLRTESAETVREQAYQRLLAMDDEAQEEMDRWIREADAAGASADQEALQKKLNARIEGVVRAYREFLGQHPEHGSARLAFGSFLNDTGQEEAARQQWERVLEKDPKNAAVHNNLAGLYGHRGPVTNAISLYEKAIELDPREPVYYRNFATTVYLFRKDAMEYYGITDEQKVFDKALALYRKAAELRPDDFIVATDLAQTYYGIKPLRYDDAMAAWQRAYLLAGDDLERQGVRVHLARIQMLSGRYGDARHELGRVTNAYFTVVKERIVKTLESRERGDAAKPSDAVELGTPAPGVHPRP